MAEEIVLLQIAVKILAKQRKCCLEYFCLDVLVSIRKIDF